MRPRRLALAALVTGVAGAAPGQAPSGTVDITIAVQAQDSPHVEDARVEERYVLASSPLPIELRILTRPCAAIGNMRMERAGVELAMVESRNGPWITLRDSSASGGDSLRLFVRYDVRLAGTGSIPLVHLTAPLATVSVTVRFAGDAGRVVFPHMTRQAPDEWSARYVAVPSFVEVAGVGLTPCGESGGERVDNGGLVWRFFLLVGIMVAWVPLYLAWARRSGDSA